MLSEDAAVLVTSLRANLTEMLSNPGPESIILLMSSNSDNPIMRSATAIDHFTFFEKEVDSVTR
jgi:hypothetical protein